MTEELEKLLIQNNKLTKLGTITLIIVTIALLNHIAKEKIKNANKRISLSNET